MRKPTFCICENKDADQLRGNREADQRLSFRYTDSTIPLLPKSVKPLAIFCGCTGRFVWDLVGNPKTGFLITMLKYHKYAYFLLVKCENVLQKFLIFSNKNNTLFGNVVVDILTGNIVRLTILRITGS